MTDTTINVDHDEIAKFEKLAARWWDPESEFKPLHDINPLRLDYIDRLAGLQGKRVLDVGCGGGLLTEGMAARGADVTGIDMGEADLGRVAHEEEGELRDRAQRERNRDQHQLQHEIPPRRTLQGGIHRQRQRARRPEHKAERRRAILNDSISILMAAEQGQGIALSRWSLVARDIAAGRLVRAIDTVVPTDWSYYFVAPPHFYDLPKIGAFRDWIVGHCERFERPDASP